MLITSGLAALIAAASSFGSEILKGSADARSRQCDRIAIFLQDEAPSPYIDERTLRQVTLEAAQRFRQCNQERL